MGTRIKDLTKHVQPFAEVLARRYGIKNMLSAGVVLLNKLPSEERDKAVDEANGAISELKEKPQTLRDFCKNVVKKAKEQKKDLIELPRTIFKITPADEESDWFKILGPEPSEKKKKAKGG